MLLAIFLTLTVLMQYLAKVHSKKGYSQYSRGLTELQLLASNPSEHLWELISPARVLATSHPVAFNEQVLVLVDINDDEQVVSVIDASQWVVDFVAEYLTHGLTPQGLADELDRAEQWRQSLTLQTQEVRRRALETAARRDEIQNLEKRLKLERETSERKD
ncbi:MAG: hypothetical protein AAFP09_08285 [Cyanobacteria bacterium J06607_10]